MLQISQWASEQTGLPDVWTAVQFDMACAWLGGYIESKVSELDEKGKPRHTLEDVLTPATPGVWGKAIGMLKSLTARRK